MFPAKARKGARETWRRSSGEGVCGAVDDDDDQENRFNQCLQGLMMSPKAASADAGRAAAAVSPAATGAGCSRLRADDDDDEADDGRRWPGLRSD